MQIGLVIASVLRIGAGLNDTFRRVGIVVYATTSTFAARIYAVRLATLRSNKTFGT